MIEWAEFEPLKTMKDKHEARAAFFAMIKKDLEIENNPKADKMLDIAWEEGHAFGYNEVYIHACNLVELIR